MFFRVLISFSLLTTAVTWAQKTHGIALHGTPKYAKDFQHFDHANPHAPQGGTVRLGVVGSFDSLNPFILQGTAPVGLSLMSERLVFEPLMERSPDEPFSLYGLIAQEVDLAQDRSSITFYLNPKAQWADGQPLTAQDVIFSYETFKTQGRPNVRAYYGRVQDVTVLDAHTIRFTFKPADDTHTYDPELPFILAMMTVLPKHIFQKRPFNQSTLVPFPGTGPYEVASVEPGRRIVYKRRATYWGKDLPVRRGSHNFDAVDVRYFRDNNVALIAFQAGDFDIYSEGDRHEWNKIQDKQHQNKSHRILKITYPQTYPLGMLGYALNMRRFPFNDIRVREALQLLFPFELVNKTLFEGLMVRSLSFYNNAPDLSNASRTLSTQELKHIPAPAHAVVQTGKDLSSLSLERRAAYKKALALFKQAGWSLQQGRLVHQQTGKALEPELLLSNKKDEKTALIYASELKKMGIRLRIRTTDTAQFTMRLQNYDFDMVAFYWGISRSPGAEQEFYHHSRFADIPGSRNYAGVKNDAVDALTKRLPQAKTRLELCLITTCLDRLLLNEKFIVPLYYAPQKYMAYWSYLKHPDIRTDVGQKIAYWWHR
jgi:ABC-type oligopeptide transport system substrate-binding subunit